MILNTKLKQARIAILRSKLYNLSRKAARIDPLHPHYKFMIGYLRKQAGWINRQLEELEPKSSNLQYYMKGGSKNEM